MQAVVIEEGELRWRERADPTPGDTELLVSVRAAGLNGADMVQRRGHYPAPPGWPEDIPGMELAGEVVATGRQVTRFFVGDRVMALVGGGAQASLAVVDESHALALPAGMPWAEAGGFPEVFATAYDALFTQCRLGMGERLLVTGAAGGVGTAAVQLGAATGARVVASVRHPDRRAEVGQLGALDAVGPTEVEPFGPFDVALELVGATSLPTVLKSLAVGGRVSVIGVGSGARLELNLFELMGRRAWLGGSTLRVRDRAEKAHVVAAVGSKVVPLLADGRLRVPVCCTFPMAEADAAYRRFEEGGKLGKIVLLA